jgi:hypothetical protein
VILERNRHMARITIEAVHGDGQPRRWTLSERVVAANLDSDHYITQLVERLSWATADAEALERDSAPRRANPSDMRERPVPVPVVAPPAAIRASSRA